MRRHIFADEAGNFDFSRKRGATKYFILTTVTTDSCDMGAELLALRREMAWAGTCPEGTLHATADRQQVRDEVFDFLVGQDFRIDATILEKRKAQLQTRPPAGKVGSVNIRFYQYAWYYHFKYVGPQIINGCDELMISAASIGTKKKTATFRASINDVAQQSVWQVPWRTAFWSADSDPCLQIVDYCCWAIQRKWEGNDDRSYKLIEDKIRSEYDLWRLGTTYHY